MKRTWLLPVVLLAATSIGGAWADSASHQKKVLAMEGLLGFWAFEDNFADGTANKNDAKPGGKASQITFGSGVNGGRAVLIDNRNDDHNFVEVNTPIGSIFDVPNHTIVFWARNDKIRPNENNDQWNSLVDRSRLWYTSLRTVADVDPPASELVVRIYGVYHDAGATPQIGNSTSDVAAEKPEEFFLKQGEWHQFAMTYDGKQVVSYVDAREMVRFDHEGKLGPTEGFDPSTQPQWNLTWGLWQQRGDDFTGAFDDTAYFNRALTGDEIKALYDAMQAKPVELPPTAGPAN